jgi:hypothetical protein
LSGEIIEYNLSSIDCAVMCKQLHVQRGIATDITITADENAVNEPDARSGTGCDFAVRLHE